MRFYWVWNEFVVYDSEGYDFRGFTQCFAYWEWNCNIELSVFVFENWEG